MICLMPNCAYISETSRMISIYRALQKRGADVCVATHGGTHERLLRACGVPYDIVGKAMSEERCREFVANGAGMGPVDQSFYTDDEMRAYVRAEVDYFRQRKVKAAVTGFVMTANLSARLAGAKLVTEHCGAYVPPLWERNAIEAPLTPLPPWTKWLPGVVRRAFANAGGHRAKIYLSGFHRVGKELGLPPIPSFAALMLGDLALVTEIPEVLGVPRDELERWRPKGAGYLPATRLRYTGPIFAELDVPMPERVASFVERPGPTVYVAITSSPEAVVRSAIASVRAAGAKALVAGTVHASKLADLDGGDVLIEGVLPSHQVMPLVDAAFIAGGQGSVQCAMASGKPFVGVPLQPEQDINVSLLERQQIAHRIAIGEVGSPRAAAMLRDVLTVPAYREGARRIGDLYARVDGPGACADALISEVAA